MEIISFIVLVFLSLVGYSAGAVGEAGKSVDLRPRIIDLILLSVIWAGAIHSRIVLDFNDWIVILIWVVLSIMIGISAVWFRKLPAPVEKASGNAVPKKTSRSFLKRLWQSWGNFSKRMGNFQSRIMLSLFFFIVVSPFALGVKIFSDPLRLKCRHDKSHWLLRIKTEVDLEQSMRQF